MNPIVEISSLSKNYGSFTAVNNLSLTVYQGDVYGFLGPNGAGKSTTIRMLLTLVKPTSGTIRLFGKDLTSHRQEILKATGAIIERPDFYNYLSARRNLELFGRLSGADISSSHILEVLDIVDLADRSESRVKTFSHGMKQRLGIAQALLHNPHLIVLDEPTTGLDPQGMKDVRSLIISLARDHGKTVLLSSHLLSEVEAIASRMVIINKGAAIIEGSVQELVNESRQTIKIKVDSVERAVLLVRTKFPAIDIADRDVLSLSIIASEAQVPAIVRLLVESGVGIHGVVANQTLEDVFLARTLRQ